MVVADPGKAVLAPVISARASLVVGEIVPRIAVVAVILADRAPLALAEVWPPLLPRHPLLPILVETHFFYCFAPAGFCTLRHCFSSQGAQSPSVPSDRDSIPRSELIASRIAVHHGGVRSGVNLLAVHSDHGQLHRLV